MVVFLLLILSPHKTFTVEVARFGDCGPSSLSLSPRKTFTAEVAGFGDCGPSSLSLSFWAGCSFSFFLHIYFLSSVFGSLVYGSKGWRHSLFDSMKFPAFLSPSLYFFSTRICASFWFWSRLCTVTLSKFAMFIVFSMSVFSFFTSSFFFSYDLFVCIPLSTLLFFCSVVIGVFFLPS
jgi:hypothetical protein